MTMLKNWGLLFVALMWVVGIPSLWVINRFLPEDHHITYFNKFGGRPWYMDGDVYAFIFGVATVVGASIGLSVFLQSWIPLIALPGSFAFSITILHWRLIVCNR